MHQTSIQFSGELQLVNKLQNAFYLVVKLRDKFNLKEEDSHWREFIRHSIEEYFGTNVIILLDSTLFRLQCPYSEVQQSRTISNKNSSSSLIINKVQKDYATNFE